MSSLQEHENSVVPPVENTSLTSISHPPLREHLEQINTAFDDFHWPLRVTNMDNPRMTKAFGLEKASDMKAFIRAARRSGILVPTEISETRYTGKSRFLVFDREQMLAAQAIFWTISPELEENNRDRFRKINWQEAYEKTMDYTSLSTISDHLHDPSKVEEVKHEKANGIVKEQVIFENPSRKEEQKKPLNDTSSWDPLLLESALSSLQDFENIDEVIPDNVLFWMMQLYYPASSQWTHDQVKGAIEGVMREINTDPQVGNLHELILKVQNLQRQRGIT